MSPTLRLRSVTRLRECAHLIGEDDHLLEPGQPLSGRGPERERELVDPVGLPPGAPVVRQGLAVSWNGSLAVQSELRGFPRHRLWRTRGKRYDGMPRQGLLLA